MRAEKLDIAFQSDQIIENAENDLETSSLSISTIFYVDETTRAVVPPR